MILSVSALSVRRGSRIVVDDLSLTASSGEIVGVVGSNGCGKSTLLTCIAGVLAPRAGQITIDGASVWGAARQQTDARRALGYVPEGADPPGFLTGTELWSLCATTRMSLRNEISALSRTPPPATDRLEELTLPRT